MGSRRQADTVGPATNARHAVRRARRRVHTLAAFAVLACACKMHDERAAPSEPMVASPTATAAAATASEKPRFVAAGDGADGAAVVVRRALEGARRDGRSVVVYVGATWCEPCQRFHAALERGELDGAFPKLTLVEFDSDRDGDRLRDAGYSSNLVPLFAVPAPDGRASGRQMEGSIKGSGAVAEITPRLRALLAGSVAP